jgi:hypothetical protein
VTEFYDMDDDMPKFLSRRASSADNYTADNAVICNACCGTGRTRPSTIFFLKPSAYFNQPMMRSP